MTIRLFKYTNIETGLKILENRTLWLSNPDTFNDPFDCYEKLINFKITRLGIENYVNRNYFTLKKSERERKIKYFLNYGEDLIEDLKRNITERKESMGVVCFSKIFDSILMWSHYSRNHTGVCLEFRFNLENKDFFLYPVMYITDFIKTDYLSEPETSLLNWVLSKSVEWAYEKEVRAVSFIKNGFVNLPPNVIKGIYFGSKILSDDKKRLIETLLMNKIDLTLYQMKLSDDRFKLIEVPISPKLVK